MAITMTIIIEGLRAKRAHTEFQENEALINRKNYGTLLFKSKQVSLPKISSIL